MQKPVESTDPPSSPEAEAESKIWKDKGNKFYQSKEYTQAIDAYTKAIQLHGNNATLWSNRSACYMTMGDPHNALLDAEVCRRIDTTWTKACYRLALARLELGMYEDAALAAFEGCKLDQSNLELKKLLNLAVEKGREAHQKAELAKNAGKK